MFLFLNKWPSIFDSAEECINLDRPNLALDDNAKTLPPNRSSNVDKLNLLKNTFRLVGKAAMAFNFKKCCTAKGQRFHYLNKNHFRTYSWLVYSENRIGLYCKYCAILSTFLLNCGVGKNCQKPVIEPFCSINKLTGSDGYLYEHDRLEHLKSMTIEVRWRGIKANLLIVFIISKIDIDITRSKL